MLRHHPHRFFVVLVVCAVLLGIAINHVPYCKAQLPSEIRLGGLFPLTGSIATGAEREAAARYAVEQVNADADVLPDVQLRWFVNDTQTLPQPGLLAALWLVQQMDVHGFIGAASSGVSKVVAVTAEAFFRPQISYSSTSPDLSNRNAFPMFTRMVPGDNLQMRALAALVQALDFEGIAIVSSADAYGVGGSTSLLQESGDLGVAVAEVLSIAFTRTLTDVEAVTHALERVQASGAHVIVVISLALDAQVLFKVALERGMLSPDYVWICADGCMTESVFVEANGVANATLQGAMRGLLGTTLSGTNGTLFDAFLDEWSALDPNEYAGSGQRSITLYAPYAYDAVWTFARAMHTYLYDKGGQLADPEVWGPAVLGEIVSTSYDGVTGPVSFDENGDRVQGLYSVRNWNGSHIATVGGYSGAEDVVTFLGAPAIIWPDGTTNVPNFRDPIAFFSCSSGDAFTLQFAPEELGLGDVLPGSFECDDYVDCSSVSDERHCSPSTYAAYVGFGVVVGLFVLVCLLCSVATIAMWFHEENARVVAAAPLFLVQVYLGCAIALASLFSFYGMPSDGKCVAQPWLSVLGTNVLLSAFLSKMWRLVHYADKDGQLSTPLPFHIQARMTALVLAPAIMLLIVWSGAATPAVKVIFGASSTVVGHRVCDHNDIYVVVILLYEAALLLVSTVLSLRCRQFDSMYAACRSIGYSVFALTFVGAVGVLVLFVVTSPLPAFLLKGFIAVVGFGPVVVLFAHRLFVCWTKRNLTIDRGPSQRAKSYARPGHGGTRENHKPREADGMMMYTSRNAHGGDDHRSSSSSSDGL